MLIGSLLDGISPYGPFYGNGKKPCILSSLKPANSKNRHDPSVPYNKLLTNLACLSCTVSTVAS